MQCVMRAHAGDGAHCMLRGLSADLPQTRTPWEQVLRVQMARALAPRRGVSWSRPGDDRVRHVALFAPGKSGLCDVELQGGGDTDFTPLLEEAARHRPDIAVVLTDLDGRARWRPPWPVYCAVPPAHAAAVAPFGRVLCLD